nr:pyridoxamine 5'-phosphate oxidase family protein [Sneathiella limimaris]
MPENLITDIDALQKLYGDINPLSLEKETIYLTDDYRAWIEKSRFFALATGGVDGLDCSPRGDQEGQVLKILDDRTLLIPDRKGNNRLDSLKNIIKDPQVGLLFLIPGINEALRINGRAVITTDQNLIDLFELKGSLPRSVIHIEIEAVYFQCARALIRSDLWNPDAQFEKSQVPTAGKMMKAAKSDFDGDAYDSTLPERQRSTLY